VSGGSPLFLNVDAVLALHRDTIERFGGEASLRDRGLLESALAAPENAFLYAGADLYTIAAYYAFHIAENQPFVDGNKRAALASALDFLGVNGVTLFDPEQRLFDAMIAISAKRLGREGLAELFRALAAGSRG